MTTSPKGVHQANSELRWQAVEDRDRSYDGRFVYAVDSTGVYCRPTCPSRRPQQSRVHFFDGPEEAERAGYRACRRCLPDQPSPQSQQAELVRRVCDRIADQIQEHPEGLPSLSQLSQAAGVSPSHLQRVFRKELGLTPRQYAHARRLERFKSLVRQGNGLSDAMFDAGFSSSSRLYESSGDHLGMTPGKYRKGGAGLTINHLVTGSTLGYLLVAATGQGVCSVKLGDEPARLVEELQAEFPGAVHQPGGEALEGWVGAVLEYLEGRLPELNLPLDVRATAFQRRVWQLLQSIPCGETRTYQQVALELGLGGNASRAVGQACASNPAALIIPCHRAVRQDGGLAGYRWGLERKAALLAMEGQRI
jgi:AraC family transcriptional regulator of adaptative response/methylated-DNA-[protein]-cysteine methyltransferase